MGNTTPKTETKPLNRNLRTAKAAKQDEFYTQYVDIQKEVEAYLEFDPDTFRGKVVYCNCDDPFESNFFKYFAANFNTLGLKKLITTSYDGSPIAGQGTLFPEYHEGNGKRQKPKALAVILDAVKDEDGDGAANIDDVKLFLKRNKAARIALKADDSYAGGDFRSAECIALLNEADIVAAVDGPSDADAGLVLRFHDADNYVAAVYSSKEKNIYLLDLKKDAAGTRLRITPVTSICPDFRLSAEVRGGWAAVTITDGQNTYNTGIVRVSNMAAGAPRRCSTPRHHSLAGLLLARD